MLRANEIEVVGTVVEVEVESKKFSTGNSGVVGKIVVKANDELHQFSVFGMTKKKDGSLNKLTQQYLGLGSKLNKRVKISGNINSRRYFADDNVRTFTENSIRFVNDANGAQDVAKFVFEGFVNRPLEEKLDNDGKLQEYTMELGQVNYKGDNMMIVKFALDKDNAAAAQYIRQQYTDGATVRISGDLINKTTEITIREENAFGGATVTTKQRSYKRYMITAGGHPIQTEASYNMAKITELKAAYADETNKIMEEGKAKNNAFSATSTSSTNTNTNSNGFNKPAPGNLL